MRKIISIFVACLFLAASCPSMKRQEPDEQFLKKKKKLGGAIAPTSWSYWQSYVDFNHINCSNGTTCTLTISATHAGSVQVVGVTTTNNVTISATSSLGSNNFTLCGSSSCHTTNAGGSQDAAYILNGQGGQTTVSIVLSSASGTTFTPFFAEVIPPPGTTASIDATNALASSNCNTCALPALTLTATDAVIYLGQVNNASAWNACNNSMINLPNGACLGLNLTSVTSPTIVQNGSPSTSIFSGLAFKSSAGTFSVVTPNMSIVNATQSTQTCNPSCSITIPATTIGNLLVVQTGTANTTNDFVSSVSGGGGTWTACSGANIVLSAQGSLSCAYNLSPTSSVTSITVTMAQTASTGILVWEMHRINGNWSFDVQNSSQNSASFRPPTQSLTLNGVNDAVFQSIWCPGGAAPGPTYGEAAFPGTSYVLLNAVSASVNFNTPNGNAGFWPDPQNNATAVYGIAFQ